jgi:hypothetical protein
MAIIQRSKTTPKIMLTKDVQVIFTAINETRILMIHVENMGQLNRKVCFYTEMDELISEHSLSANASIAFNFSDNEYVVNEGIKAKQDDGEDVSVIIDMIETIVE